MILIAPGKAISKHMGISNWIITGNGYHGAAHSGIRGPSIRERILGMWVQLHRNTLALGRRRTRLLARHEVAIVRPSAAARVMGHRGRCCGAASRRCGAPAERGEQGRDRVAPHPPPPKEANPNRAPDETRRQEEGNALEGWSIIKSESVRKRSADVHGLGPGLHGLGPGVDAHPLGQVCTAFGQVCTILDAAVALGKKGGKRGGGADRAGRGGQGGTGFSYWFKRIGQANASPAGLMGAVCSRSARGLPAALHLRTASGQEGARLASGHVGRGRWRAPHGRGEVSSQVGRPRKDLHV